MIIPCANPLAQFLSHQSEIEAAVLNVLRANNYILGSEVEAFETEFSRFIGTKFAVGVANGTDALELALRSLNIGLGDEVITVSHTAVATVAAIEAVGAIPVLVDVDPISFTLNPENLPEALSSKTKAIIAVHLYGHPANLEPIKEFCLQNEIYLIEDVSQAHGAEYMGKKLGSIGDIGCFSCYPTKNLGAIGDAGIVTTSDSDIAKRIRMIREYGWEKRYISELSGRNSRLDELQAAILRVKLRFLDQSNDSRIKIAEKYSKGLVNPSIQKPSTLNNVKHVFHLYVIRVKNRDKFIQEMGVKHIGLGIHYPIPIHLQSAYKNRIKVSRHMEVTEKLSKDVVSLPIFPELSMLDVDRVIESANLLA